MKRVGPDAKAVLTKGGIMLALILGLSALACTVALLATTATSATAESRGQRNWNKAEESGYRDRHGGYGYRRYNGPYVYYGMGRASASPLGSKL
jgi:hypothetical protein